VTNATKSLISIVISTKNNSVTIRFVLESVKRFSEKYLTELIVIDGRSSDGTLELVRIFTSKNKHTFYRILLLQDPGTSLSYARHLGFKHSLGEYIVFLDGDMVLHPDFIANFEEKVLREGDADVISVQGVILGLDRYTRVFNMFVDVSARTTPKGVSLILPARIFKREALEKLGGYPVLSRFFGEDKIATALAIAKGLKHEYFPELKILKIDEPSFKSYFKKHVRYGKGIARDLSRGGRRVLRDYILIRRLTYLNILVPALSVLYMLRAKQQYRETSMSDLLSVFMLKYVIDLAMLLGELEAILKRG